MSRKITTILLAATVAAALFFTLRFGCLILALTGIPCPGCGMTRAYLAFFHMDFERAFLYHPLFPSFIVLIVAFLCALAWRIRKHHSQKLPFRLADVYDTAEAFFATKLFYVLLVLFISAYFVVYTLRVLLPLFHIGDPTVLRLLISG